MERAEKVIALYKYIKELCALKYRVVTDVEKQYWTCFLKDIQVDTENIKLFYRDRVEGESDNDSLLLEVKKPEFQRCPQPPEILEDWLVPDWERYTNTAAYKETLIEYTNSDELIGHENLVEYFGDSVERVNAYERWSSIRAMWVEKQKMINNTRRFFARLFQMHIDLERESESLELIIGDGLIQDMTNTKINHPILLKRAKFIFDAKNNIIAIHDTDSEPELYTLLLQEIEDIDHSSVKQLKEELRDNFYHPLDRNDTPDFLKTLTHRLCSDSKFIKDTDEKVERQDKLVTRLSPVFFIRKRIDGTLKAIEEIITSIESTGFIPGHLVDIVDGGLVEVQQNDGEPTIDEKLAALSGENVDILLSKEANREQLEIAERIEQYNAVLVQGPPGTGKTHTIANLLGHFLAQGKNVLVTSHTKKALSVLKDKVSDEIKNLCVSILDDTNLDMERSVDGISEYLSRYTSNEIKRSIDEDSRRRAEIIKQLAEVRRRIYAIKYKEFEPIVYNGDGFSPAKVASFVNANAENLSYIPGKVIFPHSLPLTSEELIKLYRSNAGITEAEEVELGNNIPNPELLPTPLRFASDFQTYRKSKDSMVDLGSLIQLRVTEDFLEDKVYGEIDNDKYVIIHKTSFEALECLSKYISTFNDVDGWMICAVADGKKDGGYRAKWCMLADAIEDTAKYADSIVTKMIGNTVEINKEEDLERLKIDLQKIDDLYAKKGKIGKLDRVFDKRIDFALAQVRVNNKEISSSKDCSLAISHVELLEKRRYTAVLWNEMIAKYGPLKFFDLGDEPEQICIQLVPSIKRYLDWYKNEYIELCNLISDAGFDSNKIFMSSDLDPDLIKTEKILRTVQKTLSVYIEIARYYLELKSIELRKQGAINVLSEQNRKNSSICRNLINAIQDNKIEQYEILYNNLLQLYEKYDLKKQREGLLDKIEPIAPEWADAIRRRLGIHGETSCPQNIEDAWKWKQFVGIIDSITAEPYEELQYKSVMLSKKLRDITATVAAKSAWYHLLSRTERDISMKQALQGWKLTVKKIGKGTGKNAPALKKQARELMAKCQLAVPAWIMPINKAMESLNPAENRFDVVIIDEASQSDVSALAIVYMAKKVIIVGDDKQVSPLAVGMDIDRMNALREMYIKGLIPNWHLYDAKTSLYDIAATTFQPLMLREHFRCVPDIIGYCNKLSYDFKIKPLRDASKCSVKPPLIQFRVNEGQRDGKRKTNQKEAETIVSLMMACMEQKEYEGMTFGVISLLGDEQAQLIQEIILEKIEPSVIESRCILCGNACHFQGDERDIVFLSIVDSNEGDGPLTMAGEGADQSRKQRYNVAVSRAKDQIWVVHSLDYSKDLKPGDLRRDLLEYVENPFAQLAEKIRVNSESPFEEAVGKALLAAGYHLEQQREVGAYRIDMVAIYRDQCVAIECDGELFHSRDDKVRSDMERQAILERLGWRFIRIRGSEYYRNPNATIERVIKKLNEFGIFPEGVERASEEIKQVESELISRVKIRATQIIDEWTTENEEMPIHQLYKSEHINKEKQESKPVIKKKEELPKSTQTLKLPCEQKQTIIQPKLKGAQAEIAPSPKPELFSHSVSSKKVEELIKELKIANLSFIDKSEQSGILWIVKGDEPGQKEIVESILNKQNIRWSYEGRGAVATNNKPAWRIMIN